MPSTADSRRCSALSNWIVGIRTADYFGLPFEVVLGRRRIGLPFEARRRPGVACRFFPAEQRPPEVCERHQVAERKHHGAGGREYVQQLELRRVLVIAARHAEPAEQVLRKEREVEAEE